MAYKSVANVKDSVQAILTGVNLNAVQNLLGAFERTARELTTRIYIPEAMGKTPITLYDGVTDYASPTDLFGAAIVDFRPQGTSRTMVDFVTKQPSSLFDRTKAWITNGYHLTLEFVKGVGRLRVVSTIPTPKIELDPMTSTTGWAVGGSASALIADTTVFWQTPASLRFTLTGASSGTLTKTISSNDLTDYVGVGVVFLAIRTPSATNLTSISVKIGSSASAYYQVSTTTGFLGAFTTSEWILVALDLATATTVGSPDVTKIVYTQVTIAHAATLTNFYTGDLWISLPSPHDLIYQTTAFFQASGANPLQTIASVSDTVLLTDAALVIFEYECANTVALQQGGTLSSGTLAIINSKLNGTRSGVVGQLGLYDLYRGNNPSQELRQISNWYDD